MAQHDLAAIYRDYLDCLNRQDWGRLGQFVADAVIHNGQALALAGYRAMLERDFRDIPDLRFSIDFLVADAQRIACRLVFDCTPHAQFLGLPVQGRRVSFVEHVFYAFEAGKIVQVWSVIDKAAIEAQLAALGNS